jgi:tetratricopeptide (TPR) repeat protein
LDAGDAQKALSHFETAQATYPENLGEQRRLRQPDADVHYYTGLARQELGDEEGAQASFERVLEAPAGPASETAYYQALALRAMGEEEAAIEKLQTMLDKAKERLEEQAGQGFATSVPEFVFVEADLETRRRIHLNYIIGLALMGLGRTEEAKAAFEKVLEIAPDHGDARMRLGEMA